MAERKTAQHICDCCKQPTASAYEHFDSPQYDFLYWCGRCGVGYEAGSRMGRIYAGDTHACRESPGGTSDPAVYCSTCEHIAWPTPDGGCGAVIGFESPSAANSYTGDVTVCDCDESHAKEQSK